MQMKKGVKISFRGLEVTQKTVSSQDQEEFEWKDNLGRVLFAD